MRRYDSRRKRRIDYKPESNILFRLTKFAVITNFLQWLSLSVAIHQPTVIIQHLLRRSKTITNSIFNGDLTQPTEAMKPNSGNRLFATNFCLPEIERAAKTHFPCSENRTKKETIQTEHQERDARTAKKPYPQNTSSKNDPRTTEKHTVGRKKGKMRKTRELYRGIKLEIKKWSKIHYS